MDKVLLNVFFIPSCGSVCWRIISCRAAEFRNNKNRGSLRSTAAINRGYQLHFRDPEQLQESGYRFECRGQYEQAIAIYQDIVKRFPKYKNRLYLRDRVISLKEDLHSDYVAIKAREESIASAKSQEELAILKSRMSDVDFWQLRATSFALRAPLQIFIHPAKNRKGYRPELHKILVNSLAEWPKATAGKIQFKLVDSPATADVECFWTDKKSDLHNEAAAAITKFESVGKSKIFMLTMLNGSPVSNRFARSCCLHEFGHALGLSHSRDANDIMCGFNQRDSAIPVTFSRTDKARILNMYSDEKIEEGRQKSQLFIKANMAYAQNLARTGDRAGALKAIDDALEYDKTNASAWLVRSGINVRMYQFNNAVSDLAIAEKFDPANKRIILAKRSLVNVFRRNYVDARSDFAGALDAGFITPVYYAGLAITKTITRQDSGILKNVDDAIARSPFEPLYFKIRALICFLEGDTPIENTKTYIVKNNWKDSDAIGQLLLCYFWAKQSGSDVQATEFLNDAETHARTDKWKVLIRFVKGEITETELRQTIDTKDDTIDLRLWTSLTRVKPGEELASKEIVQSIDEKLCAILSTICWRQFYDSEVRASIPGEPLKRSSEL